jgi:hypothetical protein
VHLLLALAELDPTGLPDEVADLLGEAVLHIDIDDTDRLSALAKIRAARGESDSAASIFSWALGYDLLVGRRSLWLEPHGRGLDTALACMPEDDRDALRWLWIDYLARVPWETPNDAAEAARLDLAMACDDETLQARVLSETSSHVQDGDDALKFPLLAAALARAHAQLADVEAFKRMLDVAPALSGRQRIPPAVFDCLEVLPPAEDLAEPAAYARACEEAILAAQRNGALTPAKATRSLCLLGRWCADGGLNDLAGHLLQQATDLAGPTGEHWLWMADLARSAGDVGRAVGIETQLVNEATLPVVRAPRLLDEIEATQGQSAADQLAERVAVYSAHPAVLKRAIRSSRNRQNEDAARAYQERLAFWSQADAPAQKPSDP